MAMGEADGWAICRVGYVETARAIGLAAGKSAVKRFLADWPSFEVVEVDVSLAKQAVELTFTEELRSPTRCISLPPSYSTSRS